MSKISQVSARRCRDNESAIELSPRSMCRICGGLIVAAPMRARRRSAKPLMIASAGIRGSGSETCRRPSTHIAHHFEPEHTSSRPIGPNSGRPHRNPSSATHLPNRRASPQTLAPKAGRSSSGPADPRRSLFSSSASSASAVTPSSPSSLCFGGNRRPLAWSSERRVTCAAKMWPMSTSMPVLSPETSSPSRGSTPRRPPNAACDLDGCAASPADSGIDRSADRLVDPPTFRVRHQQNRKWEALRWSACPTSVRLRTPCHCCCGGHARHRVCARTSFASLAAAMPAHACCRAAAISAKLEAPTCRSTLLASCAWRRSHSLNDSAARPHASLTIMRNKPESNFRMVRAVWPC